MGHTFFRFCIWLTTKWSLSCLLRPMAIVLARLPSSRRPWAWTTVRYINENLRWLSYKGIGTLYTNTKRTKQSLDFFFRDKGKGDHEASTTSNFKLHGFQTLLTGVFKRRLIPSDIRRYPGATSFVAFFALIDIFLTGLSSTASKDGLWSLKPSKLVNSRLVMLSRLSSDPVWKSFLGICYTASS